MKKPYLKTMHFFLILTLILGLAKKTDCFAQTIILQEDFEASSDTMFVNTASGKLLDGQPACGRASRTTATESNSLNVDFKNAENSTYFLAVNPESPCGGYYQAYLKSDTLDISGYDSLYFRCRYFVGSQLGWGPSGISIEFNSPDSIHTLDTVFKITDTWTPFETKLPQALINDSLLIMITMGGGEGVALDDFVLQDKKTQACTPTSSVVDVDTCAPYTSPSGKYVWAESNTYKDTVLNGQGCDSVITVNLTVTPIDTSVTHTDNTLSANYSSASYQWLDCDNALSAITDETNQSFTASANGNYAVEISYNGCTDTSKCYAVTGISLSKKIVSRGIDFRIYPNPATEWFSIQTENKAEIVSVKIFDITGRTVGYRKKVQNGTVEYHLNQNRGVYFVRAHTADNVSKMLTLIIQ